ncbi:hypothetical protein [Streptomyces iranensis]|uniref:Integral membrane protein n=2 Tax=Streptomyces iranensis TaxID=576784 RepID=A0ABS4MYL7_9ACTN|nr:hypothetical protein [Streptomyces iranensis]MBP2064836.1 hypothetical protein [Streptomyces iranensis]
MSNPYQPSPSPYVTGPMPPAGRPKMFNTRAAQVLWTLLPIVSLGLAGAVPLVAAAVKGVVRPVVPAVYVAAELAVFGVVVALGDGDHPVAGLVLILFIIAAATHTALLDSERVTFGK